MDSATNDTAVWIILLSSGNGAIVGMFLLSWIPLICFCICKYQDRERCHLNMEFGKCCFFVCRFKRYIPSLVIIGLCGLLLPILLLNIVTITLCLTILDYSCQALSGTYLSLAIVLLFLYLVCIIVCSRPTCKCGHWRYRRNLLEHSISDNQGTSQLVSQNEFGDSSSREEYESIIIDNRFLDPVIPDQPNPRQPESHQHEPRQNDPGQHDPGQPEPHQPEPHQPELHQPEPCQPELHQPEPRQPELHRPERRQPELHQPEPRQPELHQPEPHQPELHQHTLHQPESHLPHQNIGNPSTEFGCIRSDMNQEMMVPCGVFFRIPSSSAVPGISIPEHVAQAFFVLGDIHTLHITTEGGTFSLHPFGPCGGEQQVECCATLEAPPGVVGSGVTVSVHYAIILDGPFKFPEEWKRTSVVLYIDCPDSRFLIERLTVNLHHWAVSSGASRMCFMKSDHLLQKGQTMFTFRRHANVIPSQPNVASVYLKDHFCLVCVAATSDVMVTSRYYGILLSDPLKDRVERFWLCITYAVPSWVEAVAEYYRRREGSKGCCEIPEYEEMQISYGNKVKIDIENENGLGWTLSVTKKEVLLRDVDTLSRYTSCREKEKAVRFGSYPPSVKFTVTYDTVPSPETHKPIPKLARLSSESGDTISLSFMVQEEKGAITDVNMLSNGHVQGAWAELTESSQDDNNLGEPSKPLTVQHLMPYINDLADEVVSISGWLGMHGELEVIKRTQGMITPREQVQELLKKWLEDIEHPTAPHTWDYFVRVVQGVRKGHTAKRIVHDIFKDKGPPSDLVALEKRVVSKMADSWFQFGDRLGLSKDTLKAVGDSNLRLDNSTRCLIMFRHWMEEFGPIENKIDMIEQAMEEVVKSTESEVSSRTSTCEHQQGEEYSLSNDAIAYWAKKMADYWLSFGIALGFSKEDLQSIKDLNDTGDSDSNEVCCSAMLYRWMETGDQRERTHERLIQAAKVANPPVVANGMCPEPPPYSESQTSNLEVPSIVLET